MNTQIAIGTKVRYINGSWRGEIIEVTDERVRIQWFREDGSKDKRTWQARKAQGKRWAVVTEPVESKDGGGSCYACSALSVGDPAGRCDDHRTTSV